MDHSFSTDPVGDILPHCRRAWRHLVLFVLILLGPVPALAGTMDALAVVQKLQDTYEQAATLVADFSQTTTMKFSSRVRQGGGSLIFHKPGRMRWDYVSPDHQILISDGETISMYFEKSRQMIVSDAKEYLQSDVTYSFFAGTGDIARDFAVSEADGADKDENSFQIKLIPKASHPHVATIHAWVSRDSYLITRLQIIDHFDTVTDLFFNNIQIDAERYGSRAVQDDLFIFTPPAGTEIIEQFSR